MKTFKQYIFENHDKFVPGVYGDGDHEYSVDRLVKFTKDLKPTKLNIADLIKINHDTETLEGNFGENIQNPSKEFSERVDRADTQYPLLVHSSGYIIDGSHRLAKLHREGQTEVNAHVLTDEDLQHAIITYKEESEKSKRIV